MGVTGLWRLVEPAGKPVPVETLENKVLAVDISIWLHQMVKGYQDAKGAPLPNAHLIGLFQRLCKLLYFRIKPVFVFDGGFPDLKRETIAKRQDHKSKYQSESERLKRELALLLSKKTAIGNLLGNQTSPKKASNNINNDDLFKLPALPQREEESESESEDEQNSSGSIIDVHSIDINSENFKNLPVKEKYDLLMELKETRKMNSWGKLHELPKKSDNFSDFQMQRLLKRRKVQECIVETEKEMGSCGMSLNELESLLNEEGIDTKINSLPGRIASNNTTRFLLINNVKQAIADAKKTELKKQASVNRDEAKPEETEPIKKDELDEDLEKAIKMSLECDNDNNDIEAAECSKTDDSWTSFVTDSDYSSSDSEEGDGFGQPDMSCAKNYILQYSDFTSKAIDQIIAPKKKTKGMQVKGSIKAMDKETVAKNNIELSSSEDEIENLEKSQFEPVNIDQQVILDETQSSVIFVDNPEHVLEVSSNSEDDKTGSENQKKLQDILQKSIESESSDDDFEEVEEAGTIQKPVVELTLNSLKESIDDDIFADVFAPKVEQGPKKVDDYYSVMQDSRLESSKAEKCEKGIVADKAVNNNIKELKNYKINEEQKETNLNEKSERELEIKETTKITHTNKEQTKKQSSNDNVKSKPSVSSKPLSKEILSTMAKEIEDQEEVILQEKGKLDRVGRNITEEMTKEAQELLQIFGIPYIVAPMEAEAQCAFLETVKLTDGTITDDSDIWLFGGRTVYKNFFNQKKHVLQFLAERIEKSFNLTREQLILLALLVGSDYTTGVAGVGPVTAMEILASFPFKKQFNKEAEAPKQNYADIVTGLQQFKQWIKAGKRTDNTSLKKKLKNVNITDDFPSVRVVQAYLEPNIEKSDEKFTWGDIDITILRDYTRSKFGWSQSKLDEIINPVLKRILERKSQKSVYDFFKRKVEFQSLEDQMSKRVKAAVQRMGPDGPEDNITEEVNTKNVRKRKTKDGPAKPGSSKTKKAKTDDINVLNEHAITVVSKTIEGKSQIEINIPKSDRFQEIIPQREKDKQHLLSNKLKAIEVFRKAKIDTKRKHNKRKVILPKEKAELSESSDSD